MNERFELELLLDASGTWDRYRAWDRELGVHVSLHVLRERANVERVAAAIAGVSALRHRRFSRFVASGTTTDGAPYVAFEWLAGRSLRQRLGEAPLSVRDTELVAGALAEALAAAHQLGIAHGALVPENVMLVDGSTARLKLTGFGKTPDADPADDALALAQLIVECGAPLARKGSGRGRGWDRVPDLDPALAAFVRCSLGKGGDAPDSAAARTALAAWTEQLAARVPAKGEPAAPRSSALLLARCRDTAAEAAGDPQNVPMSEALSTLAATHGASCSVYEDAIVSASVRSDLPLREQLTALATVAFAWLTIGPIPLVIAAESDAEPSSADSFLRAMGLLHAMNEGGIAVDPLAATSLPDSFAVTRTPLGPRVVDRRGRGDWAAIHTLAAALVLALAVAAFCASIVRAAVR